MKKLGLIILLMSGVLVAKEPVSILDFKDHVYQEFIQGKLDDVIIKYPEGTIVPLKLSLKGDVLAIDSTGEINLKTLKTCYIRCPSQDHLLFSSDLKEWKTFPEFFMGNIKMSIKPQNIEHVANLEMELDQR